MTSKDSIEYFKKIAQKPLVLLSRTADNHAINLIKSDVQKGNELSDHLGAELLNRLVNKVTTKQVHPKNIVSDRIRFAVDVPEKGAYHAFSSPFHIDGTRFLIYHEKRYDKKKVVVNGLVEFIVYNTNSDGGVTIEKEIVMWEH